MATAREKILATAAAHGWHVHELPEDGWQTIKLRRVRRENGHQRTEYLHFMCDFQGRLVDVSWAPRLDGFNGRSPSRARLTWTIQKLSEVGR